MPVHPLLAPFIDAVRSASADTVRQLLAHAADLVHEREATESGWAALHHAVAAGWVDGVRLLLDAGSCPDLPSGTDDGEGGFLPGERPLAVAAWKDQWEVLQLLLQRGADAKAADPFGHGPLHVAAALDRVAMVDLLLANGADPNAFSWHRSFDEQLDWHYAGTPLHLAASNNAVAAARRLLAQGASLDACLHDKRPPLFYAAATGSTEVAELLLRAGADPNARENRKGYSDLLDWTPLHYAAQQGHAATVRVLLAHGANPSLQESQGHCTPLDLAKQEEQVEVVELLS